MSSEPRSTLDLSLYKLRDDDLAFFKSQTGIHDEAALQDHIIEVQADAYAVYPYTCIRRFTFTSLKISRHPDYLAVLRLGKERPQAILLDLGCCFGIDVRKAILDGYPPENIVTSDLHPEFWALGHKLFKSSPETFCVPFYPGDIFDPAFLSPAAPPIPTSSPPLPSLPSLTNLPSLTPLQHRVSTIHISSVFHLFPESQQHILARLLGALLSPVPGSIILGSQMGLPDIEANKAGGFRTTRRVANQFIAFAHSPTSFVNMWIGQGGVFRPEDVMVRADVTISKAINESDSETVRDTHIIVWSVTRAS
ncbi:hypothetical protein K439DRAFT_1650383 [Ramaria rubella]|nr:hypothetical protein K439DRAFT_1650383 [Ramaria rubella]